MVLSVTWPRQNYVSLWHFQACKLSHGWEKWPGRNHPVFFPPSALRNTSEMYYLTSMQTLRSNTSLPRSLRLTLQANPSGIRWSVITQSKLILGWEIRSTHRLITQSLGLSRAAEAHQDQRTVPFILSQIFTVWHFRWKREFSFSLYQSG